MRHPTQSGSSGYYPQQGGQAQQPGKPPRKPRARLSIPRLCLLLVCVGVFCFCGYQLIHYFGDILRSRSSTAELSAIYDASGEAVTASGEHPDKAVAGKQSEAPIDSAEPFTDPAAAQPQHISQPTQPEQPANITQFRPNAANTATNATSTTPNTQNTSTAPNKPTAPTSPSASATTVPLNASTAELWPSTYPKNTRLTISNRFLDLLEKNDDIVGWLTIEDVVDEPVVQRDNSFYLTHNASGQKSVTGALFLDESCDLRTVSTQLVVHGHNMKEGAMFGSLRKYKVKNVSFFKSHPYITFNTLYEDARYVIFAVLEVDVRYGQRNYLPFWMYERFSSAQEFNDYIASARALSHYRCNVDVQPGDRLLTLSTCTSTDDNERFLVMARKLRDGEDMLKLNTDILTAADQ